MLSAHQNCESKNETHKVVSDIRVKERCRCDIRATLVQASEDQRPLTTEFFVRLNLGYGRKTERV